MLGGLWADLFLGVKIMNESLKTLKQRRSCRKYLDKQVDAQSLDLILEAGTYAPTDMNRQAPVIVAVQDKQIRDKIAKMNAAVMGTDSDPFYGAPTVLVVLADPNVRTYVYDGALVMGNLMNAAHAVGVDSCYIFRAKESFECEEGKQLLRAWGVPEHFVGIGNCILGYRDEGGIKPTSPRKENYIIKV
jgi:nitroreductase